MDVVPHTRAIHGTGLISRPAWIALATLSFLNLLNYADRFVVSSLVPLLQKSVADGGLALTASESGWLYSSFILVYTLAAPLFGVLADRSRRIVVLAVAVALWSLLTALGGWAAGFWSLLFFRALTGIGEAAYSSVAPAVLADEFAPSMRSRVMAVFNSAIPIGAAIGFIIGSTVGVAWGWRHAFLVAGIPGMLLAGCLLMLRDPPRGGMDSGEPIGKPPAFSRVITMLANVRWRRCAFGYALQTACFGSLGFWTPTYLDSSKGIGLESSGTIFGCVIVITGIVGSLCGGWWSDRWFRTDRAAHLRVCAITSMLAAPALLVVVLAEQPWLLWGAIATAALLLVMSVGPVNAHLVNVLHPSERATGMAMAILVLHLLGDVPAVPLVGWMAETFSFNAAFALLALFSLLSGCVWWYAAMHEPYDDPA